MDVQSDLLREIEEFLSRHRMAKTTFGLRAVNDGKLVDRLRTGTVTLDTAQRIRIFMRAVDAETRSPPS